MGYSYYCNVCGRTIKHNTLMNSREKFDNQILCKRCQRSTPEARKLAKALREKGWHVQTEKNDGFKRIDIAIVEAKVNIEVDGAHHNLSKDQALRDLKRTYYSFKKDYVTLRIPNSLTVNDKIITETADYISGFLNQSMEQIDAEIAKNKPKEEEDE